MKLNNINSNDFVIIAKYLAGEMSDREKLEFEKEVESSPEKRNLINAMKKNLNLIESFNIKSMVDTNKAWDRLYGRLNDENLIPQHQSARAILIPAWFKYAASVVVILTLGFVATFYINQNPNEELVNLQTGNEVNTIVQTLSDGSVVYLASNSSFSFPQQFQEKERKVVLDGEAFFDISHNPEKPFIIETEKVIIEVLGTAFNVIGGKDNQFELLVERGKVRVTMKENRSQSQIVMPGEKITSVNNHLEKENIGNYHFAWRQKRIKFKDETLGNILTVINKNYNSNIILQSEKLKNKRITVTFYNNSLSSVTDLICTYLDLKSEVASDSSIILKPNSD